MQEVDTSIREEGSLSFEICSTYECGVHFGGQDEVSRSLSDILKDAIPVSLLAESIIRVGDRVCFMYTSCVMATDGKLGTDRLVN